MIDYLRARRAKKRGGEYHITGFDGKDLAATTADQDHRLERLAPGLDRLTTIDRDLAQLVDLHVFGGLPLEEVAALQGASLRTTERRWQKARMLLQRLASESSLG